jgi:RNA polymerase sigma factor (sigma-70 family)
MASAAPEIPVLARNQAFETLYRRYVADVYHYALALLRNPADAEDVTQTTFLNAYRAYQSGVEVEKPQNWLIKIAHNVARSRYARASRRVKEVPLEDHADQLALPDDERPNVEGLLQALWRLPFNQRAALVMRELEGRTYAEIADTIGVSVSAVETLIFRARRSMRTKASTVSALATVPLPSSLTQLFGGGGVVAGGGGAAAGGGGLLGVGLLVKTGVAVVAGMLATGVLTEKSTPADAAHHVGAAVAASSGPAPSGQAQGWAKVLRSGRFPGPRTDPGGIEAVAGSDLASGSAIVGGAQAAGASEGTASTPAASTTSSAGLPSQPVSVPAPAPTPATTQVTDVVTTVESTIPNPVSVLPVQLPGVPTLPSVGVQPPAPPSVP